MPFLLLQSKSSDTAASIPAVYDARQEEGYVLQNGNSRLVRWPDSESECFKFQKAAVCLQVLTISSKKSIAYGSLEDGSLFFARSGQSQDGKVDVQVIPPSKTSVSVGGETKHVGTLARVVPPKDEVVKAGSKRKGAVQDSDETVMYQIFVDKHAIILVRREVDVSMDAADMSETSRPAQRVTIDLVGADQKQSSVIEGASLVGSAEEGGTFTIMYSCQEAIKGASNGNSTVQRQYYATVSLERAALTSTPIELGTTARQACLVGPSLLVVRTVHDELVLYDTARGAQIHRAKLQDVGVDTLGDIAFAADSKRGRLAVLFAKGDKLCVAMSSVHIESASRAPAPSKLSLAAGLAAAMKMERGVADVFRWQGSNHLAAISAESTTTSNTNNLQEEAVRQAVEQLDKTVQLICAGSNGSKKPSMLLDAYESAVSRVMKATSARVVSNGKDGACAGNPQDAIPSGGKANGVHHHTNGKAHKASPVKENLVNGLNVHSRPSLGKTPKSVPAAFVSHATGLVVQIFLLPEGQGLVGAKNDARLILRRLIKTGKISARHQFRSEQGILKRVLRSLEDEEGGKSYYTPVDFIFDTFGYCKDLSEKHMVTMLHYMLTRALSDDIVDWFLRGSNADLAKDYKAITEEFASLNGSKTSKSAAKREKLSSKLILAGTNVLLEKIFSFSDCNETLLRGALTDEMPPKERGLLYQLLVESAIAAKTNARKTQRATHWASALSDRLRGNVSELETAALSRVQESVAMELARTESILSLEGTLRQVLASIEPSSGGRSSTSDGSARDRLPAYQIERLAF